MKLIKAPFKVKGGIHPDYHKHLANDSAIQDIPMPTVLQVSMAQHLGAPASPVVKPGETVQRGQMIAEAGGFISAAVHAPTSGTIKTVAPAMTASGTTAMAIQIEPDGEDMWSPEITPTADWKALEGRDIIARVADAGVAGMGGAGFPTHVKLSPPPDKKIDTLIINGAECEPYLTADNRLMIEQADAICTGIEIIRHVLGTDTVRVAIEDNKPEAIAAIEKALANATGDVAVSVLPTEYPHGAEKQQIFAITGREVPSGGLPMDVGALVENVGTTLAIWDAVVNGRPLTERVTTVTGLSVKKPGNILNRIGTRYGDLLDFCEGLSEQTAKIISGGPMMGLAQSSADITTTKTTSGLLVLDRNAVNQYESMPCISCGRCVGACPMKLMPCELSHMLEAEDYETAEAYNVLDCIECGCCVYDCPAHRPLVQHMRGGKAQVMLKRRQEKEKKQE